MHKHEAEQTVKKKIVKSNRKGEAIYTALLTIRVPKEYAMRVRFYRADGQTRGQVS